MALNGSYQDHHLEMFRDTLEHELQKSGSLLLGLTKREKVGGVKNYFDKLGKASSYEKTSRNQLKQPQNATFERRQISFQHMESDLLVDVTDVLDMAGNPSSDYVQAMKSEIGRQIDEILFAAISGSATVITDGSSASTVIPSASKVAVDNHEFDSGSGDVALTVGKLKKAVALLGSTYVDVTRNDIVCIAPMAQLMNLTTDSEITSADFRNQKTLDVPGVVSGINGFLGITFIAYEDVDVDGSADQLCYIFPTDAVKTGVRTELTVRANEDYTRAGNPNMLSAWTDLGAVRMFEEKVIQIACDPL